METSPLLSCQLKNGLTLLCLDKSKKIAGDRWYICINVRITIPVNTKWFGNHTVDHETFQKISRELGKEVVFQQKKERHFISDDVKTQVVKEICESTEKMGMKYFGHDDFAAKYILKVFADQHRHPRRQ
jgi:hypothetical protein